MNFTPHDGPVGMGGGSIERCLVADSKSYHQRIAEIHPGNPCEIGLFAFIKLLLCTGG